jgi:hypothetical protein
VEEMISRQVHLLCTVVLSRPVTTQWMTEIMCKEGELACFKVVFKHSSGQNEKYHMKELCQRYRAPGPRTQIGISTVLQATP